MPPLKLQPRQKIEYKKPSRINPVSISVFLFFGFMVYLGVSIWPALSISSNVKAEMADILPNMYRANLQGPAGQGQITELRKDLIKAIRKAGVKDPKLTVKLFNNKKIIAAEAAYHLVAQLQGTDYKFELPFSPRVETDATRVDW